jgi:hypothetical protein
MKKTLHNIRGEKKHTKPLMKSFLLNHKGNKYKANTLLGLLWNYARSKKS